MNTRERLVQYHDTQFEAVVNLRVTIVVEKDGVVAKGLSPRDRGIVINRAITAVIRAVDEVGPSAERESEAL
jgi:hypothetical protein